MGFRLTGGRECGDQRVAGFEQAGLDGSLGDTEDRGDIEDRTILQVVEHDGGLLALGQRSNGSPETIADRVVHFRPGDGLRGDPGEGATFAPQLSAAIGGEVGDDPADPCGRVVEARPGAVGPRQRFGGEIAAGLAVAGEGETDRHEPRVFGAEKRLEVIPVACGSGSHELSLSCGEHAIKTTVRHPRFTATDNFGLNAPPAGRQRRKPMPPFA